MLIWLLCFKVWGFAVVQEETRLITGCSDSELRMWKISTIDSSDDEHSAKEGGKRSAAEAGLQDGSLEKPDEVHVHCTLHIENKI